MRTKFLLTIAALAASITMSTAQPLQGWLGQSGLYPILSGGTSRVLAGTTNVFASGLASTNVAGLPGTATNIFQTTDEYDYVGFTWSYGAGSNATVQVFKSFDNGTTFEALPSFSYSGPAASASAFTTNAVLDIHGATTLAFVVKNASTIDQTNALLEINLKSAKFGAKPATR